jgi:hypothetical protein
MTFPAQRRRDPQPLSRGGEMAFVVLAGVLMLLGLAALAGLGMAAAVFGGGWVWPHGSDQIGLVVGGILRGDPGAGLPVPDQTRVPGRLLVYGCVMLVELLLLALAAAATVLFWRYHRSTGAGGGMATRAEAQEVLGASRLRQVRSILRPDLTRTAGPPSANINVSRLARARHDPFVGTDSLSSQDGQGRRGRRDLTEVGWRLGRSVSPRGVELWVRFDRTTGVYGAQGSGKTLDLLAPALLAHPGAALVTLTKLDDLLLTLPDRRDRRSLGPGRAGDGVAADGGWADGGGSDGGRPEGGRCPVVVLDPFGLAPGMPELVWDPIAGCVDPMVAERRAKAFAAGTVTGAVAGGRADSSARFYAAETAKVLQGFFHAAALTGRTLEHVLEWVANPVAAEQPAEILRQHPHAARFWDGLLSGALHGSADTVGNTVTTVQQSLALFFQPAIRARCIPTPDRPATDLRQVLTQHGTVYLLGREDPYASASPLMTAVAEHVLDLALALANTSAHGRLTPPFLACLDELPSTTPLPTLRTRMANERALGLSFVYAAQTWRQMVVCYGEDEARALFGLTNNIVVFGGGKDIHFYKEVSDLLGTTRVSRQSVTDGPGGIGTSRSTEDMPVLRPEHIRLIPDQHALVVAENAPPILAQLRRCVDGPAGAALQQRQHTAREIVHQAREAEIDPDVRTADAVRYAHTHQLQATSGHDREHDRHSSFGEDVSGG